MASYKKSHQTKEIILAASRKLFYEKGYINTYYEDISNETGLSPGNIHYHFKSKRYIASIIYNEFMVGVKKLVEEVLGNEYDLQIKTAVDIRTYMNIIIDDSNFRTFYSEISSDRITIDLFSDVGTYFFKLHRDEYNLNISDSMLKIINLCTAASEVELLVNYFKGNLDITSEELIEFNMRLIFEMLSIDYNRINEILEISKSLFSNLHLELKDFFKLEFIKSVHAKTANENQ